MTYILAKRGVEGYIVYLPTVVAGIILFVTILNFIRKLPVKVKS